MDGGTGRDPGCLPGQSPRAPLLGQRARLEAPLGIMCLMRPREDPVFSPFMFTGDSQTISPSHFQGKRLPAASAGNSHHTASLGHSRGSRAPGRGHQHQAGW